jgi:hypothetical protein
MAGTQQCSILAMELESTEASRCDIDLLSRVQIEGRDSFLRGADEFAADLAIDDLSFLFSYPTSLFHEEQTA